MRGEAKQGESKQRFIQRRLAAFALALLLALGGLALAGCTTPAETPGGANNDTPTETPSGSQTDANIPVPNAVTITVTVDISAAVEAEDPTALAIAELKGGNTFTSTIEVEDGTNILDATRYAGITVGTTTASFGTYVSAIEGLSEGAVTPEAGWTFFINDEFAAEGADVTLANDGDIIKWVYVTSWE